ncbi:MAG TPA: enoyl-CoA hydratase/isomerase family protein [Blastocatellia bacterium]|nr:enoyl-CoA hydratase/isomerase family protein [Blastocatellia bacterium]
MNFETLVLEVDGSIGRLVLNRPERLNAMSATMLRELAEAAQWFNAQPEVRVVIVRGAGRAFSAGADLKDSSRSEADGWLARREAAQAGSRMMDAVEAMKATTIAAVHGYAVGGAVLLAAACDLRLAAEDALFSIPEVELGIPLAWGGIPRLVREIGPAMTKELVITCRQFTPHEAKQIGFINRVVPADELEQQTVRLAKEIAAQPAVPVAITKEHVNAVTRAMAGGSSYADGDVLLSAFSSAESLDARKTYVERRLKRKGGD